VPIREIRGEFQKHSGIAQLVFFATNCTNLHELREKKKFVPIREIRGEFKVDSAAKRVLYRRDRRVRRAIFKKISALSAFSAMSFCNELLTLRSSRPLRLMSHSVIGHSVICHWSFP
jgi:hypothetical protein